MKKILFRLIAISCCVVLFVTCSLCFYASASTKNSTAHIGIDEKNQDYQLCEKYDFDAIITKSSMDITVPNVDLSKVIIIKDLSCSEKEELKIRGYTNDQITNMDYSSYYSLKSNWTIDDIQVRLVLDLDPNLNADQVSKWTVAQYEKYISDYNTNNCGLTEEQKNKFERLGISISDAIYLSRKYYGFDNVLLQSVDTLKADLEEYYKLNLEYLSNNKFELRSNIKNEKNN